jgi:transglutaminase-like putative cysteine protease
VNGLNPLNSDRERNLGRIALSTHHSPFTTHDFQFLEMTDQKQPVAYRHVLYLLLSLVMVAAPHAEHLPWWIIALTVALFAWRAYVGHARLAVPNRWFVILIAIGSVIGVFLTYRTIFGREAGVALLVIMLGLKLLESRTLRDAMLLTFLGYFLVVTNFLYEQTIPTALYMIACTWVITATMLSLHYAHAEPPFRAQLRTAGLLLAQSVPLMLVLFLLFPRVPGPLWGMPQDAFTGVSGLSDTMTPGSLSSLILSDAVAFRVKFKSAIPRRNDLYWRGPVMWDFDGRTWRAPRFAYTSGKLEFSGNPVNYEVTLEPHSKRWLFALDLPAKVPPRAFISTDNQLYSFRPVSVRMRYDMTSLLNPVFGQDENPLALRRALHLPEGSNPKAQELARTLRAKHADDGAIVDEVLSMFREQKFYYTLTPPLLGEHAVDEFLFSTRNGFCEHYASAFTVLMRAAGIPARVVTGYQGGEINDFGNYLIVRQSDAHAWTEVWLQGKGWARVDPTSAVSPARVSSGISAVIPQGESLPSLVRGGGEWLHQFRLSWDFMANTWNQWVLGYTPERQRWLLENFGMDNATWQKMAAALFCLAGVIVAIFTALALRQLKDRVRDPVKIAYARFCDKLRKKGLPRDAAEGPADYARRLESLRPDLAPAVTAITRLYVAMRYGAESGAAALAELQQRVRRFSA